MPLTSTPTRIAAQRNVSGPSAHGWVVRLLPPHGSWGRRCRPQPPNIGKPCKCRPGARLGV
eukprot:5205287-Pyramimonas_sp.AAC.1